MEKDSETPEKIDNFIKDRFTPALLLDADQQGSRGGSSNRKKRKKDNCKAKIKLS